ncbi:MAG TPA: hypothetical protein VKD90_01255 [Gemmataceae bacterium]|nr:hypothetical protein [Gemmataceae bacterium]
MIRLCTIVPAALLLATAPLAAAPRPGEKSDGPAIVGQAKSFNDLLEMTKATVKNVGGEQFYKMFEKDALPNLDPGKLPGIDPKRPFGLYGILDADVTKWRGVLLIPVTSERDFIDMLDRFDIRTTKGKDAGTYDVVVPPDVPFPVALRIHKQYAYVSLGGFDALETKVILDPKDVISDKEKGVAYLSIRPDRMSPETRKYLLAAFSEQTDRLKEMIPEAELKDAFHLTQRLVARWLKLVFDEGKEVALRLDADTKTGEVFLDISIEGQPKSSLATAIAARKPTTNAFATLVGPDYAHKMFVTAPLFADEAKEAAVKMVEHWQKVCARDLATAPPEAAALVEAGLKSLKATVESGELDFAGAIRGPNKDGFYTAVAAVHCKEGAQLEKAIRAAVKVDEKVKAMFKFDAGKVGDLSVHEIDLSTEAGGPAKKIFGDGQKAYFTFGKNAIFASYGPDGMNLLKEAIAAKPGPAPVFDASSDPKKAGELIKRMIPEGNPNAGVAFRAGWLESMTTGMRVTVDGGEKLKVRASYNVGMLLMFFGAVASDARPAPVAVPAK